MRKTIKYFLVILSLPLLAEQPGTTPGNPVQTQNQRLHNILFVVDRSGSMEPLIPEVRSALRTTAASAPRELEMGLIDFAGCGPQHINYSVPLAVNNAPQILQRVNQLVADGATDLFGALRRARDIAMSQRKCLRLAVFTDFYDTCAPNASQHTAAAGHAGVAAALSGLERNCVQVNLITFQTQFELRNSAMSAVVNYTGGTIYYGVRDAAGIREALLDLFRQTQNQGSPAAFRVVPQNTPATQPTTTPQTPAPQPVPQPVPQGSGGQP